MLGSSAVPDEEPVEPGPAEPGRPSTPVDPPLPAVDPSPPRPGVVDPGSVVVGGAVEIVVDVVGAVVDVGAVVVVVVPVAQVGVTNVLLSSETCPFRASARPWTTVPVVTVIDVRARIVPTNDEVVPRVAELPTCQKTLHAWALLIRLTLLAEAGDQRRGDLEDEDRVAGRPGRRRSPCR